MIFEPTAFHSMVKFDGFLKIIRHNLFIWFHKFNLIEIQASFQVNLGPPLFSLRSLFFTFPPRALHQVLLLMLLLHQVLLLMLLLHQVL